MLYFFTEPYNEEILYGTISRYHFYSGNLSYQDTLYDIFGSRTVSPVLDFPNSLNYLESQISNNTFTSDYLIRRHTLFQIYEPFLSIKKREEIINIMKETGNKNINNKIGLTSGQIHSNKELFYCPQCTIEDIEKHGEPYFHRVHQFQGVLVCPHHECKLKGYRANIYNSKRYEIIRLDKDNIDLSIEYEDDINLIKIFKMIADAAYYLLNANLGRFHQTSIFERYLKILQLNGYMKIGGRIDQAKLYVDFKEFYSDKLLDIFNSNFEAKDEGSWIRTITKNNKTFVHPLRHILFIFFLYGDVEKFFNDKIKVEGPFGDGPWPCLNPICPNYKEFVIDECSVKANDRTRKPMATFQCECGFKYTRSCPDHHKDDLFKITAIRDFGDLWRKKLKEHINQNIHSKEIAKLMQCNEQTVLKHADYMGILDKVRTGAKLRVSKKPPTNNEKTFLQNKYRMQIEAYIKENNQSSRLELRHKLPVQYQWIYENDREWLYSNVPESMKPTKIRSGFNSINWGKRDKELVNKIKREYERLLNEEKPVRITRQLIAKRIGRRGLPKEYDRLPEVVKYLDEICESVDDFNYRKIDRVCSQLYEVRGMFTKWDVIMAAGIKNHYNDEKLLKRIEENIEGYRGRQLW